MELFRQEKGGGTMRITKKKIKDLKHPERNVRMHTDKQIAEFQRSVKMFGQIRPIVVDEQGVILAGNGLYDTLVSLGYTEADCYVVKGLSENEKKKLMLSDNRIFDLGVDDMSAFDAFIQELGDDLDVPGFDEDLLKSLLADAGEVDDMMSSYGLVDDEKKAEIAAAKETYEQDGEAERTEQETQPAAPADGNTEDGTYIVCPKCGEKIWL
jgi:ParB-like chromosome segregation protein Spo0J